MCSRFKCSERRGLLDQVEEVISCFFDFDLLCLCTLIALNQCLDAGEILGTIHFLSE